MTLFLAVAAYDAYGDTPGQGAAEMFALLVVLIVVYVTARVIQHAWTFARKSLTVIGGRLHHR